ncbi:MAG: murein biosynthesis integral membrane protein MurJ [Alphaproteobacteria bacterium]|nr:murein biosynthesis integral membrane protein MurJ [Alphaproteobacteria bacterium]
MKSGFAHSLFTVSSLTIVSRIGGFVRDSLTAVFLGAGPVADAFFVAQRLPNLFRSLFAEGAFSAAFVPLYTSEQERNGDEAAQRFAGQALMLLLTALLPFSVLVMMFMPKVMLLLAPGFEDEPEKFALAVRFSTITFPYLALISVTALQTGVLNARGLFAPGAAAPIAYNIVLILGLLASQLFDWQVGYTLAWAVTVSGVVQCAWLALSCRNARASIPILRPQLSKASSLLFRRIGPGAVGAGAAQINLLVSTILASTLPTGAVSYLFYADRLNQLPLGIVGIAVATTLLPLLSRHVETGDEAKIRHFNSRAIEFCLLLGLPSMVGLLVFAEPIIETLFEHGAFTHGDTLATAATLRAYALGIPGFLLVKVYAADFFARHDTKTPVKAAMLSMGANVLLSVALLIPLGHIGIALSNSFAVTLNAGLHYYHLRKSRFPIGNKSLPKSVVKIALCATAMAAVALLSLQVWHAFSLHSLSQKILALGALIALSGGLYAAVILATGAFKLETIKNMLKEKPPKA